MILRIFSNLTNSMILGICKHQWLWQRPKIKGVHRAIHENVIKDEVNEWVNPFNKSDYFPFISCFSCISTDLLLDDQDTSYLVQQRLQEVADTVGLFSAYPNGLCVGKD